MHLHTHTNTHTYTHTHTFSLSLFLTHISIHTRQKLGPHTRDQHAASYAACTPFTHTVCRACTHTHACRYKHTRNRGAKSELSTLHDVLFAHLCVIALVKGIQVHLYVSPDPLSDKCVEFVTHSQTCVNVYVLRAGERHADAPICVTRPVVRCVCGVRDSFSDMCEPPRHRSCGRHTGAPVCVT